MHFSLIGHELSEDAEGLPAMQLHIEPAPSNELGLRLDAVRDQLTYMIDGTTPGLLISPTVKVGRTGMAGSYRYRRDRNDSSRDVDQRLRRTTAGRPVILHVEKLTTASTPLPGQAILKYRPGAVRP